MSVKKRRISCETGCEPRGSFVAWLAQRRLAVALPGWSSARSRRPAPKRPGGNSRSAPVLVECSIHSFGPGTWPTTSRSEMLAQTARRTRERGQRRPRKVVGSAPGRGRGEVMGHRRDKTQLPRRGSPVGAPVSQRLGVRRSVTRHRCLRHAPRPPGPTWPFGPARTARLTACSGHRARQGVGGGDPAGGCLEASRGGWRE